MSEREEKKGYEIKAEVESHDNKFHPTGGEMLGEIWRRHACTLPVCNLANTVAHTHRFVWTLSSPFNILQCVPVSRRGRLLRGCFLSDGRIQTAHGRGVSPNGGTCEADGTSVIPAWGPTGTDWSTADDVTHCLSLFVVLSVTEDAYCLSVVFLLPPSGSWVTIKRDGASCVCAILHGAVL